MSDTATIEAVASDRVGKAVQDAETFVAQHPTLDASAVISVAMQAVAKFRAVIPAKQ